MCELNIAKPVTYRQFTVYSAQNAIENWNHTKKKLYFSSGIVDNAMKEWTRLNATIIMKHTIHYLFITNRTQAII